jgi:hypothetical protein
MRKVAVTVLHNDQKLVDLFKILSHALTGQKCYQDQDDRLPQNQRWYFKSQTKVMNFFRALGIGAKFDARWSITSDYNSVLLSFEGQPPADLSWWLNILLTHVVKPDEKEDVPKCESAL